MPKRFRCRSIVQSYNILDSEDYRDLKDALQRAEIIINDPFFIEKDQPDQTTKTTAGKVPPAGIVRKSLIRESIVSKPTAAFSGPATTPAQVPSHKLPLRDSKRRGEAAVNQL